MANPHNRPGLSRHLFTLSIWRAPGSGGGTEWHGQLQHVLSGETRPLDDLADLLALLGDMLPAWDVPAAAGEPEWKRLSESPLQIEGNARTSIKRRKGL